jgi:hypothetical protein
MRTTQGQRLGPNLRQILAIAIIAPGLLACGGALGTANVTAIAIARQQITTPDAAPASANANLASDAQPSEILILEGTVEQRLPLLSGAVYRLKDDSGSLWIRTDSDAPLTVGDRLKVQVELRYQAIPVGDRDWGEPYAIERDRLDRQSAP